MELFDALEKIEKSKGYEVALMTTFNFDIPFFERAILSRLRNNNINTVSVFVDQRELNKSVQALNKDNVQLGRKYVVNPVDVRGAFHPKLILLLGVDKAKLFIASANLTASGYFNNNEIFNEFVFDNNHLENQNIIYDAYLLFQHLNKMSYGMDAELFDSISNYVYLREMTKNGDVSLLHNCDENILGQVRKAIPKAERIDIAVPFYDNNLNALSEIRGLYPEAHIRLIAQNRKSRLNMERAGTIDDVEIMPFDTIGCINHDKNERLGRSFYHGKVIRFICDDESWTLYGSANCTDAALNKTYHNGGNIECDILEKGNKNEFEEFFDCFQLRDEGDVEFLLLNYLSDGDTKNYWFKYGAVKDNLEIELHIGFNTIPTNIEVCLGEIVLQSKIDNNEIVCTSKIEDTIADGNIISITIKDNEQTEIKCWILNKYDIQIERNSSREELPLSIDFDSDGDKYCEERINILKAMALTLGDYGQLQILKEIVNPTSAFEEDSEDDVEGIISYRVPTADEQSKYKRYEKSVEIGRSNVRHYLYRTGIEKKKETATSDVGVDFELQESKNAKRTATTAEMRFKRFVKSRVKDILNPEYIEVVSEEHLLNVAAVFLDTLSRFPERKVAGMFERDYEIEIRQKIAKALASKNFGSCKVSDEYFGVILKEIVVSHVLSMSTESADIIDSYSGELIRIINTKSNIRDTFKNHLNVDLCASIAHELDLSISAQEIYSYIDSLFGYCTKDQLSAIIKAKYPNAEYSLGEKNFSLKCQTSEMRKYFNAKDLQINRIKEYYAGYQIPLETIKIEIVRNDENCTSATSSIIYNMNNSTGYFEQIIKRDYMKDELNVISAGVRKSKEVDDTEIEFNVGDKIHHSKYGDGTIVDLSITNNKMVIDFSSEKRTFGYAQTKSHIKAI